MARRRTARELQQQLEYAQRREAPQTARRRAPTGAVQQRPKVSAKYVSMLAPGNTAFVIQIPRSGLQFFANGTLADVGLADNVAEPTPPRSFRPNRVLATVADATPSRQTATRSGRPYIRYQRGNRGSNVQSNFSCPFQDTGATPTPAGARTKFRAIAAAVSGRLGGPYGRVWAEWESYPMIESGGEQQ